MEIAWSIFHVWDKHLSRMPREIPHSICVKAHNNYWNIHAEPSEELQYPSVVPIAAPHEYC